MSTVPWTDFLAVRNELVRAEYALRSTLDRVAKAVVVADAVLAQYEKDMAEHRKAFDRDVKDLDRTLAAWKTGGTPETDSDNRR